MKATATLLALLLFTTTALAVEKTPEPWKGPSPGGRFTFGGMAGGGVLDSRVGFTLFGSAAVKIVDRGWADMNNQVFVETQLGPLFLPGLTAFQYHLHLRWDFIKNDDWTFFGMGGIGGIIGGGRTIFYPHFGVGAMWNLFARFSLRAELSHEFFGGGVSFPL